MKKYKNILDQGCLACGLRATLVQKWPSIYHLTLRVALFEERLDSSALDHAPFSYRSRNPVCNVSQIRVILMQGIYLCARNKNNTNMTLCYDDELEKILMQWLLESAIAISEQLNFKSFLEMNEDI